MEKLLTFSIAAYNVEKYLTKLITSIAEAGHLPEMEILVINDGSKDGTAKLTKEYESEYPDLVRLVDKENGGHGSTINRGIIEATGKYFRALDGDDWINTVDLVKLLEKLKNETADAILCNYLLCYENGKVAEDNFSGLVSGKIYDFDELALSVQWMRYHTLIYRTAILKEKNIRLDEHCFYVDSEFMIYPIPYINTIRFYDYHLYCYRLGLEGQSVSPAGRLKHASESYKVTISLLDMYRKLPTDISDSKRKYIARGIGGHCIWHFRTIMYNKPCKEKKHELISFEKMIKDTSKDIFDSMEDFGKTSNLIKVIRKTNYLAYRPICLYKQLKNS